MDRKAHWESVYQTKHPTEVSWYQQHPEITLSLIQRAGLPADAAVIDVGGGASRLVDCLLDLNFTRPAVLDISVNALRWAQDRLGSRAENVDWFEADVTQFESPHPFHLWHDRAVFHFLTDAGDRQRYINTLRRALRSDGQAIIAAFAKDGPTMCSGLPIVQYDPEDIEREFGEHFQLCEVRREAHTTPAGKVQHFHYFRMKRRS